jgi:hypothetical protein
MRTFLIFLDVPKHVEYQVSDWPVMNMGQQINVKTVLRDPQNLKKSKKIDGIYIIKNVNLNYSLDRTSRSGLSQYIELEPFL